MKNKKGNVAVIAIIIVIVAITAGALGWMFAKKTGNLQPATNNNQAQPAGEVQVIDETVDWQTYDKHLVSLKYPQNWNLEEHFRLNEIIGKNESFLKFKDSADNVVLILGFEKNGDDFYLGNPTGIPAGNFVEIGNVSIAGIQMDKSVIVNESQDANAVVEGSVWYKKSDIIASNNYKIFAMAFTNGFYDKTSINTSDAIKTADKILSTFKFTDVVADDYFLIPEAGIKFKVPASLKDDLIYTIEKDASQKGGPKSQSVRLTTKSLIREGGDGCRYDGLGRIVKIYADFTKDAQYVNPPADSHWAETKKGLESIGAVQFDGFFVFFVGPQAVCSDKPSEKVNKLLESYDLSQYVKNVELIK